MVDEKPLQDDFREVNNKHPNMTGYYKPGTCYIHYHDYTKVNGSNYHEYNNEADCKKLCDISPICGALSFQKSSYRTKCTLYFGIDSIFDGMIKTPPHLKNVLFVRLQTCYRKNQETLFRNHSESKCFDSFPQQLAKESRIYPKIKSLKLCGVICEAETNCTGFSFNSQEYACSLTSLRPFRTLPSPDIKSFRKKNSCVAKHFKSTRRHRSKKNAVAEEALVTLISEAHESALFASDLFQEIHLMFKEMIDHLQYHQPSNQNDSQNRVKRSVLGGIGEIFSSLFGFGGDDVSQEEIEIIKKNLKILQNSVNDNRKYIQKNVALINLTRIEMQVTRTGLNKLSQTVLDLNTTMTYIWDEFVVARNYIVTAASIVTRVSVVRMGMQRLLLDMNKLKGYLNTLTTNKVNHDMVSAPQLRDILIAIEDELREHPTYQLPADPRTQIWDYYPLLRVIPVVLRDHIAISLEIPLVDRTLKLKILRAHPLPLLHPTLQKKFQYHLESTYMALTNDDHYVSLLYEADVMKCTLHDAAACKLETALYPVDQVQYCIFSLYKRNPTEIDTNCKISLTSQPMSEAINLDQNQWAVAMLKPETLEIKCRLKTSYVKVQPPLQFLTLPNGCAAYSPSIRIPAYMEMTKDLSLKRSVKERFLGFNKTYVPLTEFRAFDQVFPFQHVPEEKLQKLGLKLPDIPLITKDQIPGKLEQIDENYPWVMPSWLTILITILGTIISLLALAGITYVCYLCKRRHQAKYQFPSDPPSKVPTELTPNIALKEVKSESQTSEKTKKTPLAVKFDSKSDTAEVVKVVDLPHPPDWMTDSLERYRKDSQATISDLDTTISTIKQSLAIEPLGSLPSTSKVLSKPPKAPKPLKLPKTPKSILQQAPKLT